MAKLSGKVALITGGASGIGEAIAKLYAAEGAAVAIVDLATEKAQNLANDIAASGGKSMAAGGDVSDEAHVAEAVAAVQATLGDVDILVNAAGAGIASPLDEMSSELWDRMVGINLRSAFLLSRAVLPAMKRKKWGRIILFSSQLAHKGAAMLTHYCAAKAGVVGLTRALAYEVAPEGITVNCINPGPIDTPLLRALPQEWLDAKQAELPIGRFGRVEEVAPTALMLASDDGSYYVGASLNMNGGDYMI